VKTVLDLRKHNANPMLVSEDWAGLSSPRYMEVELIDGIYQPVERKAHEKRKAQLLVLNISMGFCSVVALGVMVFVLSLKYGLIK
jgi:hypothetical protein